MSLIGESAFCPGGKTSGGSRGPTIQRLNNLAPATGERHEEGNMAVIDR